MRNIMNDKMLSQDLHQNFIMNISNIIIIVVNKMSFQDQKLVSHLLDSINFRKKQNQNIFTIILHNFCHLESISAVEHYITVDIKNGFQNIDEKALPGGGNKRFFITENPNIVHCVMAKKYSDAGNEYNASTFEFLKRKNKKFTSCPIFRFNRSIFKICQ